MAYWILQHNPANLSPDYRPPSGIPSNRSCWRINRYVNRVSIDDVAFIWYTNHNRHERGVYNVSTIVSVPPHSAEFEGQVSIIWESFRPYFDPGKFRQLEQYTPILIDDRYSDDFHRPVTVEELRQMGLGDLLIIRMPRWGIYSLDHTVGEQLLEYIQRTRGRRP